MRKLQSQGVHHITLVGADRQTSIDFWEGVLGMPFIFEQPNLDTPRKAISTSIPVMAGSSPFSPMRIASPIRADLDGSRRRPPPRVLALAGHLPAGGRAPQRARDRAQRREGPRLHGLDLLQGSTRPADRAGLVSLRAAQRLHPCGGSVEAHRIRIERDDYNIAEVHLADAIETLVTRRKEWPTTP